MPLLALLPLQEGGKEMLLLLLLILLFLLPLGEGAEGG